MLRFLLHIEPSLTSDDGGGGSFITYISISVALLRLMGDVLVSCPLHSNSGVPDKFILYFLRALIFSIKPYSLAVQVAVAMVASVNTIVACSMGVMSSMINCTCG